MSQHLFIVSRQQPDLYSYLAREFSGEPEVRVILDRRHGERRRRAVDEMLAIADRRRGDRRGTTDVRSQLSSVGYAFVRLS